MTTYTPNFKLKRSRDAVYRGLKHLRELLHNGKQARIHHDLLAYYLGERSSKPAVWLQQNMLIATSGYTRGKASMRYALNIAAFEQAWADVHEALGKPCIIIGGAVISEKHELAVMTGAFEYQSKGEGRRTHGLQNMRSKHRRSLFSQAGYVHDYDVRMCAPTLLYQQALRLGADPAQLLGLKAMLDDPDFRSRLAERVGLTTADEYKDLKALINALPNGLTVSQHSSSGAVQLVGWDVVERLMRDEEFKALHASLKYIAAFVKALYPGVSLALFYQRLERLVANVMYSHAGSIGGRCFLEHDGIRTDRPLDVPRLEREIEAETGFKVTIEHELISQPGYVRNESATRPAYTLTKSPFYTRTTRCTPLNPTTPTTTPQHHPASSLNFA